MKRTTSQPTPVDFDAILHSHLPCSDIFFHYCKYIHAYPNSSPLAFLCAGVYATFALCSSTSFLFASRRARTDFLACSFTSDFFCSFMRGFCNVSITFPATFCAMPLSLFSKLSRHLPTKSRLSFGVFLSSEVSHFLYLRSYSISSALVCSAIVSDTASHAFS